MSVGISPVSSVGLRTWLWGGVGGGNRHTERQISQPPSRHITSDVSSEKEEKGSMLQELRWKLGYPVLYNLLTPLSAQISGSKFQNLSQIPLEIRGVWKIVVFDLKLTQNLKIHSKF